MLNFVIEPDIELRVLELADAPALESLEDGFTSHRNEWLYRGTAHEFIESALSDHEASGSLTFGIFEAGRLAGVIVCSLDGPPRTARIDYMLGNRHRGRGLVTRGVRRILEHLFADPGFLEASLFIDPDNLESVAVAERLGFQGVETVPGGVDYGTDRGDLRRYKLTSSELQVG